MKKLASYLSETGISQKEFALLIKKSQGTVSRYANGEVTPDLSMMVEIERLTGGQVSIMSWLNEAPQ